MSEVASATRTYVTMLMGFIHFHEEPILITGLKQGYVAQTKRRAKL